VSLESAAVRRLLFVFLLVLLPLQFSGAALMPYCQHDGQADWHLGHHEHLHAAHAPADDGNAGDDAAPNALDLDCSHCHAHGGALPSAIAPLPQALPRDAVLRRTSQPWPMRALAPPDRPQWPALA